MTTLEIITGIVAIYGALLATVTFVTQRVEKRRRLKVDLSLGFIAPDLAEPVDVVFLEAANSGDAPVHLSSCVLALPETKEKLVARFNYSREFPVTLNPGESIKAWLKSETFIETVQRQTTVSSLTVIAEFSNKGGSIFRSKPQRFVLGRMLFAKKHAG